MYCSKCGKEISDNSNYCYSCGSKNEESCIVPLDARPQINFAIPDDDDTLLPSSKTKWKFINISKLTTLFKKGTKTYEPKLDQPKQKRKYGWGWFLLLSIYFKSIRSVPSVENYYRSEALFQLLGIFILLYIYFHFRTKLIYYYDDIYRPPLISGIISIFITVFLVVFLHRLYILFSFYVLTF